MSARLKSLGGVMIVLLALFGPFASSASAVQLITPYPAVSVQGGKSVTLNIDVRTPTRQRVDLSVSDVPSGWQATLRGGGFVIQSVFGASDNPPQVQLEVKVPAGVAKGDYQMVVHANAAGATDALPVTLRVADIAGGAITLYPDSPSLRGTTDTTFTTNVTLTNNTPDSLTFTLSAEGPQGWDVSLRPSSQTQAASVKVDGGGTSTLQMEAKPSDATPADTYTVKLHAVSGSNTADGAVTVEVTGSSKVTLTTPTGRLNAKATVGGTAAITLLIKNTGNKPLRGVSVTSSPPTGWKTTFTPATALVVPANGSVRVVANVTPGGDAVAGDYTVTFNVSGAGSSGSVDIRVTVETSWVWGVVAVLIIAGAGYGLYRVFQRYGRR